MLTYTLNGAAVSCTQRGRGTALLAHNVGYHVGDNPQAVYTQRQVFAAENGSPIVWMNQTHSTHVENLHIQPDKPHLIYGQSGKSYDPRYPEIAHQFDADGLFYDARQYGAPPIALAVMTADCLPVTFADSTGQVIAVAHAGRVGLENGILLRVLEHYAHVGIAPRDISAYIGPAICGRCYEVPEDMVQRSEKLLPQVRARTSWGTPSLDLAGAARIQLGDNGLQEVVLSGECTHENPQYHSYRRNKAAGRQATIIRPYFSA